MGNNLAYVCRTGAFQEEVMLYNAETGVRRSMAQFKWSYGKIDLKDPALRERIPLFSRFLHLDETVARKIELKFYGGGSPISPYAGFYTSEDGKSAIFYHSHNDGNILWMRGSFEKRFSFPAGWENVQWIIQFQNYLYYMSSSSHGVGKVKMIDLFEGKDADFTLRLGSLAYLVDPSPDGQQVAVMTTDSDIMIADYDGRNARLFLEDAYNPDWSPDGKRLLHNVKGGALQITNIDGTNPIQLKTRSGKPLIGYDAEFVPIPGTNQIVYKDYPMRSSVILHNLDTDKEQVLGTGLPTGAKMIYRFPLIWSPDGQYFVVTSWANGLFQRYVCALNGGGCSHIGYSQKRECGHGFVVWTDVEE
jgi:WD40 repeat protein